MGIMTFDNCGNIIENPYSNKIALYNELVALRNRYEIMKANYETRLKADMVALLTEIQLEIEEYQYEDKYDAVNDDMTGWILAVDVNKIIQQKINELNRENK